MSNQPTIPGLRDTTQRDVTLCEPFLAEMSTVVPWMRRFSRIVLGDDRAPLT